MEYIFERNDRILKDHERILEELKSFFFYSLFIWTAAFVALWKLVFMIFLFVFLILSGCFSCILPVHWSCVFIFSDILITYTKKKKKIWQDCGGWFFSHLFISLKGTCIYK